jgi:tetratricopeptide (TPR) repeat protein
MWVIACSLLFFQNQIAATESPVLSSRAVRTAMNAKEAIDGHNEQEISSAVDSLAHLLGEATFRRLEPHTQVQILFLLSKGYERLGKYQEQERLLTSSASKRELYRFHVPLKMALARSFVQQHRFIEAEQILGKIIKSSCAHLSLEEKEQIANVIFFKDEYLHSLLRQADRLSAAGRWDEAIKLYETVLAAIERQQYPYQASPVEKRRLRYKVLLRMAEVNFCRGNDAQCTAFLNEWDDPLFHSNTNQIPKERRQALLALVHRHASIEGLAPDTEGAINSPHNPLWDAQEAIRARTPAQLSRALEALQSHGEHRPALHHILNGFLAALNQRLEIASHELQQGLPLSSEHHPWKEASYHLLAECAFERMILLLSSHQQQQAKDLATAILPIISSATHPQTLLRVAAVSLFLHKITEDPSYQEKFVSLLATVTTQSNTDALPLYIALKAYSDHESSQCLLLPSYDRYFMSWLGMTITEPQHDEAEESQPDAFASYLEALSWYQQAMNDEMSPEQASAALQSCLETPELNDVRPQVLHALIDLALRSSQFAEAEEMVNDVLKNHQSYPPLPQVVLSCIFSFEDDPNAANERETLCQYILDRPPDMYSLILSIHLFETRQRLTFDHTNTILPFELALIAREEGRTLRSEVIKSKEPSVMKERIQAVAYAFDTAHARGIESLSAVHDDGSLNVIWGFILGLQQELIEFLENSISSDSAFNELPNLLEKAASDLRHDLSSFAASLAPQHQLTQECFIQDCYCLAQTGDVFALTFRGQLDLAVDATNGFAAQSSKPSPPAMRALLFLAKTLRESSKATEALRLLSPLHEQSMNNDIDLALEIAMEKSLCLRDAHQYDKAKALLAWIINGPYASSLRLRAMMMRADLYLSLHRTDLAIRQLEAVSAKGGEWGASADRKLRELYGIS